MNYSRIWRLLAAFLLCAAGCTEEIYDSTVTEKSDVRLNVVWPVQASEKYVARFGNGREFDLSGNDNVLEGIGTGADRIMVFNLPSGVQRKGSVFRAEHLEDGTLRGDTELLLSIVQDVHIRPNILNDIVLEPVRVTKEIVFNFISDTPLISASAELEAAGSIDLEYHRFFEPTKLKIPMKPDNNGVWNGSARILGICDESLDISLSIMAEDDKTSDFLLSLPLSSVGYNKGMPQSLDIEFRHSKGKCTARLLMPSGNWQILLEKINIKENTNC